jgi:PKD repeat protein
VRTFSLHHAYVDDDPTGTAEDRYSVQVRLHDDDDGSTAGSAEVVVHNIAPEVSLSVDETGVEGSVVFASAFFHDAGLLDTFEALVDWGDGVQEAADIQRVKGQYRAHASHTYADNGTYTVTLRVTDDDSGVGQSTAVIDIENVAPSLTLTAVPTLDEGQALQLSGSFTDPGFDGQSSLEDFAATMDWGDGTSEALSVQETSGAAGVLTLGTITGSHVYADDGIYTLTVAVRDDDGGEALATLTLTIANLPPLANDDAFIVAEDGTLTVAAAAGVLANDSDVPADPLTAVLIDAPLYGILTLDPSGAFVYRPDADFYGDDVFSYRARDDEGDESTPAFVRVTVTPVNDVPVARDDAYLIKQGETLSVAAAGLLWNDSDADGDSLSAILVNGPQHGVLELHADGSLTYVPAADFAGVDAFTYLAKDQEGAESTPATVQLTVVAGNQQPEAHDDAFELVEDTVLTVTGPGVLRNDVDPDGDMLSAELRRGPSHGSIGLNASGSFVYTPNTNFYGEDSFTYVARDAAGALSEEATVELSIKSVNDAPVFVSTPPAVIEIGQRSEASGDAVLYVRDTVVLEFKWDQSTASFKNEVGIYAVEDATGRVNGLLPGDAGYAAAALNASNRQILFKRTDKQGDKVKVTLSGGHYYAFYLVQDASAADLLKKNPANATGGKPIALFSLSEANAGRFDNLHASIADGRLRLQWEDLANGGDRDFDDVVLSARVPEGCAIAFVQPAGDLLPISQFASGDRMFQVPVGNGGEVQALFTWGPRQASYKSEFGIYRVDDAGGRIGKLRPGDAGYAEAVIKRAQTVFPSWAEEGDRARLGLQPGGYYGFYLIQNSDSGDFLARNARNSLQGRPLAFFSFDNANPDAFDHMRGSVIDGRLQLSWEDTVRGGDKDFDDARISVQFEQKPAVNLFTYQAAAVDVEGDLLRYALLSGPAGAKIDPITGLLTWNALPGQYDFVIQVDDGHGGTALQSFTLKVRSAAAEPTIDWAKLCKMPLRDGCGDSDGWKGDFVNGLAQSEQERDPNSALRVTISASSSATASAAAV